jgi:hypothetical protein
MYPKHLILMGFLAAGCSHNVYSPPARLSALQGPEAIGAGQTAVAGELGGLGSFGADVIGFSARGRHGLTEEVELQAEAAVVHFDDSEAADTDQTPYMGSARVGTKWSIGALGHHLALTAGLGGGAHAGGGFTAADLGFVAGFQNRYVVPFYAMEGGVSLPIAASAVDTSREDEDPGTHTDTPLTTFSVRTTMGLRVPFTLGWDAPGAFAVGVQHVLLVDTEGESDAWSGPAVQFEAGF